MYHGDAPVIPMWNQNFTEHLLKGNGVIKALIMGTSLHIFIGNVRFQIKEQGFSQPSPEWTLGSAMDEMGL